ncbi:Neuralized-like protein 4 [Homalodisca vitripennis]|nr:Neuralized-like protein 4 [Homalodisca vitripennis]
MMRKTNGNLHLYINGLDQGVAATKVPSLMWGVVDLYGMTVKVTIVDRDEREEHNLITRRNTALRDYTLNGSMSESSKILSTPIKLSSSNTLLIATSFKLREAMVATSTAGCNERHVNKATEVALSSSSFNTSDAF